MKLQIALTASIIAITASAAVPIRWTVETSRVQPAQIEAYHGETIEFAATMQSYGKPLAITNNLIGIYWQTNGMGSAYWTAPAVLSNNVMIARFEPSMDVGANVYSCFIGTPGEIYRAAFQLRLRPSPGAVPSELPLPVKTLDFAAVTVLNPPYYTQAETDAKIIELSSGIAEATNHLDLSIQDKFSQHKPTAVISENPDYYRQGRAGEMGYGYAWEVLSGDGRQRFAAYAPKVSPRITLSSIDGDYDPLINHYGSLYTISNTISEVTAIAEEDAMIQAYYHQVDVSYSSTNDIPIIYHVHRNILSGVAELTDVSVSAGSYFEFEDDGVWHNVYGINSSGTNITYTDEYYDGSTWQYAERQLVVSLDDTTPAEYERIIFGGVNIVTDITKGDSISVLTERTGKPGDCGTGWGYKVFEFATDVRSWRVNVPNLTCSAVSTNTTQIRDSTYLSHYADPFYANPNALRSLTEPVRTEGKYSSDGCSNVDYKVTFYPDTLGHNPTNELVFIASGVSITNGIVSLRPVEDSRWTLTHSGNEHHGWVYHPSFVVRSTRGNQHTYNVNITDIPCEADGTIYPTRVGSRFEIKFHHTSGTDVFRFSVGGLISKTFAAYKLVNTEDQHLYYDEGLKCTWELSVTNGCFFGTRVSNDDYRRAD